MHKVRLYFIRPEKTASWQPDEERLVQMLAALPAGKKAAVEQLVQQADRAASLLGLLLLEKIARDEDIAGFRLADLCYPQAGKPYWCNSPAADFDFNISHSSGLVLAAASTSLKLGVDAEKIRPLRSLRFDRIMTAAELKSIEKTPERFFELWSQKEAVVKAADTKGISRMSDVELAGDRAVLDGTGWYLAELASRMQCAQDYAVHLATSVPADKIVIREISPDMFT